MIKLNVVPCVECKFYKGVKQPDHTEQTEYIGCKESKNGDAKKLLAQKGHIMTCAYFENIAAEET